MVYDGVWKMMCVCLSQQQLLQEALCTAPATRQPATAQRRPRAHQLLQKALCTAPATRNAQQLDVISGVMSCAVMSGVVLWWAVMAAGRADADAEAAGAKRKTRTPHSDVGNNNNSSSSSRSSKSNSNSNHNAARNSTTDYLYSISPPVWIQGPGLLGFHGSRSCNGTGLSWIHLDILGRSSGKSWWKMWQFQELSPIRQAEK